MTGANDGADPVARPGWRWDVALSFAGAQRDYVEQVARALKAQGVRCFYDADEQIELWGKYLAEELPAIYGEQAAAVVVFVSAEYAARDWTRHERRAALARAVRERREYVLPARFDDTPLPGLLPDTVWVDLRTRSPQQFAAIIAAKLAALGIATPTLQADGGGSARAEAVQRLLRQTASRPPGGHTAESARGTVSALPPRDADDSHSTGTRTRSRASVRCVATIAGHRQSRGLNGVRRGIIAMAFNPDGHTLATGSGDNTVMLWDIANPGNPTKTAVLSVHDVMATAFSPDGRTLATGTNKTAMLWDTSDRADPMLISTLPDHQGDLSFGSVKFSIDGSILTTSADGSVFLWDVRERGRSGRIAALNERRYLVQSVAFSPDDHIVATGGWAVEVLRPRYATAMLWDVSDPARPVLLSVLTGHRDGVNSVAFSFDGCILATGSNDKTVVLWDITNPAQPVQLPSLTSHRERVTAIAFSPRDRILATASDDKTAIVWDVSDPLRPRQIATLTDHRSFVASVAFSPNGDLLATGGRDAKARLWRLT